MGCYNATSQQGQWKIGTEGAIAGSFALEPRVQN